ncbi:Csu type fimbrial protein [Sphingomonas parva]|nr:spore coat U domain-containing protein [Sphingomonas parva]
MHRNVFNLSRAGAVLAAAGALGFGAAPAFAQTASSSLDVSATVTANCTVTTSPIAFGAVNTLSSSNVDGTGGVTVTCTNGTAWAASADAGSGTGATLGNRRMTAGSNQLSYNLYTDSGRSSVWGDGTGSTATVANTGTGLAQDFTVYGRVAAGQTSVPAGSYSDTVAVTITY